MSYTFDIRGECLVVRIMGEIDHHTTGEIRNQIDSVILKGGIKKVIFDFNKVNFMDSSGIGLIMGRYKLMRAIDGKVIVFGAGENIKRLFDMSGINKIIRYFNSEEEAFFTKEEALKDDQQSYQDTVFE